MYKKIKDRLPAPKERISKPDLERYKITLILDALINQDTSKLNTILAHYRHSPTPTELAYLHPKNKEHKLVLPVSIAKVLFGTRPTIYMRTLLEYYHLVKLNVRREEHRQYCFYIQEDSQDVAFGKYNTELVHYFSDFFTELLHYDVMGNRLKHKDPKLS